MAGIDLTNYKNYLTFWGNEIINQAKENLRLKGKGGGNLEKSLKAEVVVEGDDLVVQFTMADYGTFVDKGVKGVGGKIKTGDHAGSWGGRRWFMNYKGERKDSPYQFGTGSGQKGGMSTGIASFVRKKNINRDSVTGKFIPAKSIKIAIMKVLWIKGIHGISFFQTPLMLGMKNFAIQAPPEIKEDIINTLVSIPNVNRA